MQKIVESHPQTITQNESTSKFDQNLLAVHNGFKGITLSTMPNISISSIPSNINFNADLHLTRINPDSVPVQTSPLESPLRKYPRQIINSIESRVSVGACLDRKRQEEQSLRLQQFGNQQQPYADDISHLHYQQGDISRIGQSELCTLPISENVNRRSSRSLRSTSPCLLIPNPFHPNNLTDELHQYIPKQVLTRIPRQLKTITCNQLLQLTFKSVDHEPDLKGMKIACERQKEMVRRWEQKECSVYNSPIQSDHDEANNVSENSYDNLSEGNYSISQHKSQHESMHSQREMDQLCRYKDQGSRKNDRNRLGRLSRSNLQNKLTDPNKAVPQKRLIPIIPIAAPAMRHRKLGEMSFHGNVPNIPNNSMPIISNNLISQNNPNSLTNPTNSINHFNPINSNNPNNPFNSNNPINSNNPNNPFNSNNPINSNNPFNSNSHNSMPSYYLNYLSNIRDSPYLSEQQRYSHNYSMDSYKKYYSNHQLNQVHQVNQAHQTHQLNQTPPLNSYPFPINMPLPYYMAVKNQSFTYPYYQTESIIHNKPIIARTMVVNSQGNRISNINSNIEANNNNSNNNNSNNQNNSHIIIQNNNTNNNINHNNNSNINPQLQFTYLSHSQHSQQLNNKTNQQIKSSFVPSRLNQPISKKNQKNRRIKSQDFNRINQIRSNMNRQTNLLRQINRVSNQQFKGNLQFEGNQQSKGKQKNQIQYQLSLQRQMYYDKEQRDHSLPNPIVPTIFPTSPSFQSLNRQFEHTANQLNRRLTRRSTISAASIVNNQKVFGLSGDSNKSKNMGKLKGNQPKK